jgi:mannose-6-phosphate isomerase-like protein (cupin superfamily)
MWFTFRMAEKHTRRNFLLTAPIAATVSLSLTNKSLFALVATHGEGQSADLAAPEPFQIFTAETIRNAAKALSAGNKNLVASNALPFTIVLTVEHNKSPKDFEYHEGRDHVLQILDGTTHYEIGGTPKNTHNTGPGEWLASTSEGSTSIALNKGDMLVIPRGTPHKRSTEEMVTFMLISTMGSSKA